MVVPGKSTISTQVIQGVRGTVHQIRALPSWTQVERMRRAGQGPVVACLPSRAREQSSLLRIHNIAAQLGPHGWRAIVLPWTLTLAQRRAILTRLAPDLVLMQGARHDLNRPAYYPGQRIVYDMDDADFHLPHLEAPVRRAMREVSAVIAGSEYIADWCRRAGAPHADVIWTGTPVSRTRRPPQTGRAPVVAWGQTRPMTYTGEGALVLEVMRRLAVMRPGVTLRLYDRMKTDDPGYLDAFREAGVSVDWRPRMPYRSYLETFDDVAVGLAPLCPASPFSRGKSFGKVLAYLDRKVPVVASDACEHGRFFTPATGIVTNDPDEWVAALDGLLGDAERRQTMADAAFLALQESLSVEAASARVARLFDRLVNIT